MFVKNEVYNDESPDKGKAEIIIAKHRNGPPGRIKLRFQHDLAKFTDALIEKPREPSLL